MSKRISKRGKMEDMTDGPMAMNIIPNIRMTHPNEQALVPAHSRPVCLYCRLPPEVARRWIALLELNERVPDRSI